MRNNHDNPPADRQRGRAGRSAGRLMLLVAAAAAAAGCAGWPAAQVDVAGPAATSVATGVAPARPTAAAGPFQVVDVVDGDTIWVEEPDGRVKVRLLGIDTPETRDPDRPVECFGPEATAATTAAAAGGRVWLEVDPSQDTHDRYGRLLAYVWLDETTLLNRDLVTGGFAREYTYDQPYRYQDEFRSAQDTAQTAGAGLWSECTG